MVRSRRDAIAEAKRLGIEVEPVRRTGEIRFRSPLTGDPPVTLNNRRDDASRAVEKLIDRHYRAMVGPTDEDDSEDGA